MYDYENYRERLMVWYRYARPYNINKLPNFEELVANVVALNDKIERMRNCSFVENETPYFEARCYYWVETEE